MFSPKRVNSSTAVQINEITRAINQGNEQPEWFVKRAKLYLSIEKEAQALADLNTAIKEDPSLGEAYFLKAKVLVARQQYQESMKLMMQAKEFNYYTPESEAVLAETYVGLKQYDRALSHSSKAVQLSPGEAKFYVLLANAQSGTGDTVRAIANLGKALQRDSVSLPAYRELSAIYTAQKRFEEAYPMVNTGVKQQPKDAFWWRQLGQYFMAYNLTDTAMASFNRSVAFDPNHPAAYLGLAQAWYKKRQYAIALENIVKAQELGAPLNEENRFLLARCYEYTGLRELARSHYAFLARKYPQNPRYMVALRKLQTPIKRPTIDTLSTTSVF
ncbi:lipopolysaccharide assembly protein LapB [Rufibacter sp. DG15C]|uniref:tetratricopeptide repeat protein n=1 Tax=Rufibacter sp. DG15C TaxID=1379909 RepID=UPI0018D35622|nr:tetratricopeptide repeat protein [Rufibacter sp. DG15C]